MSILPAKLLNRSSLIIGACVALTVGSAAPAARAADAEAVAIDTTMIVKTPPVRLGKPAHPGRASVVLTSPVTVLNAANQPTFNLYASRIVVPTLVVWHQDDHCSFSPPAGSAALLAAIPSAHKASRTFERGHSVATDPCGAFSEHG